MNLDVMDTAAVDDAPHPALDARRREVQELRPQRQAGRSRRLLPRAAQLQALAAEFDLADIGGVYVRHCDHPNTPELPMHPNRLDTVGTLYLRQGKYLPESSAPIVLRWYSPDTGPR